MNYTTYGQIFGGIGLFLLGVELLRDGFKESAGVSLRRILSEYTDNTYKALFSGFVVSTATQSASAVILTLIGFVNARLLKLKEAIKVVLGANLGKVATAWIVVLLGFKFNITEFALPMIGVGAIIKVFLRNKEGLGTAFLGFGIIFFGLALLKSSAVIIQDNFLITPVSEMGFGDNLLYLILGVLISVITQSSAGALAMTFAALAGGIINVEMAVALVIGQNMGTTSNAILASQNTANIAKRLTAAHTLFNVICTLCGFFFLLIFQALDVFPHLVSIFNNDSLFAVTIFYSGSIIIALAFVLPFLKSYENFINDRFRKKKSLGSPRFIDKSKVYYPSVALDALRKEVIRFGKISNSMLDAAFSWESKRGWIYGPDLSQEERELDRLVQEVYAFSTRTARKQSSVEVVDAVQSFSLAVRYFEDAADYSKKITEQLEKMTEATNDSKIYADFIKWKTDLHHLVPRIRMALEMGSQSEIKNLRAEFSLIEDEKVVLRQGFLDAGARKEIDSSQSLVFIDLIDKCRRAVRSQLRGVKKTYEISYDFSDVTSLEAIKKESF